MWPFFLAQETTASGGFADVIDNLARTPLSKVVIFVGVCTIIRLALAPLLARTLPHKRASMYATARIVNEALDAIVYAGVFVFLLIRPFCIQAFKIPSGSMENTLQINDFIVANKAIYRYSDPKDGDIVVFRPPSIAVNSKDIDRDGQVNIDYIKRCIGVPGDVIEIRDGTLYRNGRAVNEPYIKAKPETDFKLVKYKNAYWPVQILGDFVNANGTPPPYLLKDVRVMDEVRKLPPVAIPPGYYLMIGDNRNNSFDGRFWGLVPREAIIGRSEFIWMPITRWHVTR